MKDWPLWRYFATVAFGISAVFTILIPIAYVTKLSQAGAGIVDIILATVIWAYLLVTPVTAVSAISMGAMQKPAGRWLIAALGVWIVVALALSMLTF